MQIQVHAGDELPIYRQIMRQIIAAIGAGQLEPGDKIPSHRDLATRLVVAPLTVKKAYDELEKGGVVVTRRGRGTFVSDAPPAGDPRQAEQRLRPAALRLLTEARLNGISFERMIALLEEIRNGRKS